MRQNRKVPNINRTKYAFVVDGECEFWYLQMLKRNERSLNINLEPKIPQKKFLKDQYELVLELQKHYDKVFWIIDFDVINSETQATKKGSLTPLQEFKNFHTNLVANYKNSIYVIINNPCLEFWFLIHFGFTTRYYNSCDKVIIALKQIDSLASYSKSRKYFTKQGSDIYLRLKPHLKSAIENSSKFRKFNFNNSQIGLSQMNTFFEIKEIKELLGH